MWVSVCLCEYIHLYMWLYDCDPYHPTPIIVKCIESKSCVHVALLMKFREANAINSAMSMPFTSYYFQSNRVMPTFFMDIILEKKVKNSEIFFFIHLDLYLFMNKIWIWLVILAGDQDWCPFSIVLHPSHMKFNQKSIKKTILYSFYWSNKVYSNL